MNAASPGPASRKPYVAVSATVFTVVSLLQFWRALAGAPLEIAGASIPVAASWVAAVVIGALALWGWRTR